MGILSKSSPYRRFPHGRTATSCGHLGTKSIQVFAPESEPRMT